MITYEQEQLADIRGTIVEFDDIVKTLGQAQVRSPKETVYRHIYNGILEDLEQLRDKSYARSYHDRITKDEYFSIINDVTTLREMAKEIFARS